MAVQRLRVVGQRADHAEERARALTDVFPGQEVIDRTFINTWQDKKTVDAVKATGRKRLIIAGLWTEVCVAMPTIRALGEAWDVTVVTNASGGVSVDAHEPVGAAVAQHASACQCGMIQERG